MLWCKFQACKKNLNEYVGLIWRPFWKWRPSWNSRDILWPTSLLKSTWSKDGFRKVSCLYHQLHYFLNFPPHYTNNALFNPQTFEFVWEMLLNKRSLCVCICVYLYSPPVSHLGESSRRVLVILDFWRIVQLQIQKDSRSFSWFFSVPSVYTSRGRITPFVTQTNKMADAAKK
jgi:hypothetical protein